MIVIINLREREHSKIPLIRGNLNVTYFFTKENNVTGQRVGGCVDNVTAG